MVNVRRFNSNNARKNIHLSAGGLWRPTYDRESRKMVPYWNSVSWVLLCAAWPAWYIPQSGTHSGLDLLHYKFYLKMTPNFNWDWSPQQYWLYHIFILYKAVNTKNPTVRRLTCEPYLEMLLPSDLWNFMFILLHSCVQCLFYALWAEDNL
jgi:hypothetical protein